jgi:hypothetical protein
MVPAAGGANHHWGGIPPFGRDSAPLVGGNDEPLITYLFKYKPGVPLNSALGRKGIMEIVSFISIEDDPPDLILSFAIWQPELDDIRSLILIRTPKYEFVLDEAEHGVKVSDEDWLNDEDDMLEEIEFGDDFVKIITDYHQFELDLRKVDKEEIEQAKTILERMNFDNRFEMRIV